MSERRNALQNGSASDGPTAMPSTSRTPSVFTPTAIYNRHRHDAAGLPHFHVGRVDPQVRNAFTRSLMSAHSRDTWLLLISVMPIALTSSSTERVDTPWM